MEDYFYIFLKKKKCQNKQARFGVEAPQDRSHPLPEHNKFMALIFIVLSH